MAWPNVLVIAPKGTTAPEDEIVTVPGTVRRFVETEFRRDSLWDPDWYTGLDADVYATFRDRPVIIADTVKVDGVRGTTGR